MLPEAVMWLAVKCPFALILPEAVTSPVMLTPVAVVVNFTTLS